MSEEPGEPPRARALERAGGARRAGWGILDQSLSSLTNFLVGIILARALGPVDFGAVSLAFAAYLLALNASRALSTEPLTVRFSGEEPALWRMATSSALGVALLVGLAAGAVVLLAGTIVGGPVGASLAALAVTLPGLLLQDAWRFAFFSAAQPRAAFLNDLAWLVLLVPALWLLPVVTSPGPGLYILAWGMAGTAAAVVGLLQGRLVPAPWRARRWWAENSDLASRYFVEFGALSGSTQLRLFIVGGLADLAVVGALRAGQILLGALHPLTYGLQLTAVPEAVRAARTSLARLDRACLVLAGGLAALAVAWGGAVLLLPDGIGRELLGPTWEKARAAVQGVTLAFAASGATTGALVGLRALGAADRSLRARLAASALGILGAVVGAATGDVAGCAWWIGLAVALGAALWWREFLVALADERRVRATRSAAGLEAGRG